MGDSYLRAFSAYGYSNKSNIYNFFYWSITYFKQKSLHFWSCYGQVYFNNNFNNERDPVHDKLIITETLLALKT